MVTQNVETELDITNGAKGTIVDVVWLSRTDGRTITDLDPILTSIKFTYTPVCIPVKLE